MTKDMFDIEDIFYLKSLVNSFAISVLSQDVWYKGYQLPTKFEERVNLFSICIQEKFQKEEVVVNIRQFGIFLEEFLYENCLDWTNWDGGFNPNLKQSVPSTINFSTVATNAMFFLKKLIEIED